MISEYTREAGVRQLERELGKVLRKTATRIASETVEAPVAIDVEVVRDALGRQRFFREAAERTAVPGVATGLAVTGVGGDVLFVEATSIPGGEKLVLTGQLGDVMKESAQIALSAVRAKASDYGLDDDVFENRSFHVHVPAGAIPKDGPSAGITMATALASLLTGRPVKHTVGMTGEVTLQGRVLPIGGLKQKVLAAHAAGLTDVVIPERNRADIDDVPRARPRRDDLPPGDVALSEVLELALEPAPSSAASMSRCSHCRPVPEEVRQAAGLLEGRWTVSILWASYEGASRFNEFKQAVGEIPPRTLAQRLVELEEAGVLERRVIDARPPRVEYTLTAAGPAAAGGRRRARLYARRVDAADVDACRPASAQVACSAAVRCQAEA